MRSVDRYGIRNTEIAQWLGNRFTAERIGQKRRELNFSPFEIEQIQRQLKEHKKRFPREPRAVKPQDFRINKKLKDLQEQHQVPLKIIASLLNKSEATAYNKLNSKHKVNDTETKILMDYFNKLKRDL